MRFKVSAASALTVFLASVTTALANGSDPSNTRSVVATPIPLGATAILIDGAPNEEVWAKAPVIKDFGQRRPAEGSAPSFETEARVLFDAANLYVAVYGNRPRAGQARWASHAPRRSHLVGLDVGLRRTRTTTSARRTSSASIPPASRWTATGSTTATATSAGMRSGTSPSRATHTGWSAEFRIPFSQLRFNPSTTSNFGFAVIAHLRPDDETSTWPLFAQRQRLRLVSSASSAAFRSERFVKLELAPYMLGQSDDGSPPTGNPLAKSPDPGAALGLDVKYAVDARPHIHRAASTRTSARSKPTPPS